MKAPEKIYLQEPTKVRTEKKYDNDVEYIRTDAFIEKALKWYCLDCACNDNCAANHKCAFWSFFKDYLEGNEKARIDKIIDVLDWAEEKGYIHHSDWEDYVCYVKSLKPQNTWKPSDEQMATFWDAICNLNQDGYKWITDMKSLYQDLKKLKEE